MRVKGLSSQKLVPTLGDREFSIVSSELSDEPASDDDEFTLIADLVPPPRSRPRTNDAW